MCGFAGFIENERTLTSEALLSTARAMGARVAHRGPDDAHEWADDAAGIAMAFRRLSILDASEAGRQPMVSPSGRYVLTFNGEIYNAPTLSVPLKAAGTIFRGHSDTEVLLALIDQHGFSEAIPQLSGMFAIACWDREERILHLARDPLGEKPLYFGRAGASFLFASQPKAFFAHPAFIPEIDRDALTSFFRFGYIPAPQSIFRGIEKLRPGERLALRGDIIIKRALYFEPRALAAGLEEALDETQAIDMLERLIGDAVERRLASDVPLGVFLSGGIDSSVVAALMRARGSGAVSSFGIGFDIAEYDEAGHAEGVAKHLGLKHQTMRVCAADIEAAIPAMADIYDEPFADPSQVPTFLLSQLTRQYVKVALSGDGGDELFDGYPRYALMQEILGRTRAIPGFARSGLAALMRGAPQALWRVLEPLVPTRFGRSPLSARALRLADMLDGAGVEGVYRDLVGQWQNPESLVIGGAERIDPIWTGALREASDDPGRLLRLIDLASYLPEDILVKVDRASMAVGLEVRAPLLDQEIVAFGLNLPRHLLVRGGMQKWLLRQVLYRHVPSHLIDRPKMGFGFPVAEWLRGPLREWAGDLLSPAGLSQAGYLDPRLVHEKWRAHESGAADWGWRLWCVLMFEDWRRKLAPAAQNGVNCHAIQFSAGNADHRKSTRN